MSSRKEGSNCLAWKDDIQLLRYQHHLLLPLVHSRSSLTCLLFPYQCSYDSFVQLNPNCNYKNFCFPHPEVVEWWEVESLTMTHLIYPIRRITETPSLSHGQVEWEDNSNIVTLRRQLCNLFNNAVFIIIQSFLVLLWLWLCDLTIVLVIP